MDDLNKNLKHIPLIIYWSVLILGTAALLFFILPGNPKFKYEYRKGFPWQHENLVAPFDFAILKSEVEIENEKAELLQEVIPYFHFDTVMSMRNSAKMGTDLRAAAGSDNQEVNRIIVIIKKNLNEIYHTGILQRGIESYPELNGKTEIKRRIGSVVTPVAIEKLYSEKTAYNQISAVIDEIIGQKPAERNWLSNISPEKYITSNLEYDKITTEKEIAEKTVNISPSRGMVQAGERIILEGEVVDIEKFQVLESLKTSFRQQSNTISNPLMLSLGKILFILSMLGLAITFMFIYRQDVMFKHRKIAFLLLFMVLMVFISIFVNNIPKLHIYLVPLAIFPIIIRTFFDSRTAIFMLFVITLIIGFYAPNHFEFILVQFSAGVVAVFSLNKIHRRVHLVKAMLLVMLTYLIMYSALTLIHEGTISGFNFNMLRWFALSSLFILLVYPLVFIFEKLFGFVSDVTLIELSDSNQPLLRKLAEEAPGTFQHSIQIANLAEDVILKIGGNPFLVRAGALYHDIGKISKPNFFIENQSMGMNPHDEMSYLKSAEVIIDHVRNGVKMAYKYKLPEPIVEFIATHHGTTKANYFFLKQRQENPGEKVDEDSFVYPGPLPKSKEATVVMLIDGIEAASRSLKDKNYETIKDLIDSMINDKIKLNQLDQSALTFNDINIIKETLLNKLINIYHVRIEYPKEEGK
jgi:putative nucleotidyltransferase with HDIG domain